MSDHGQYTGCCCCFFKLACCSLYPLADLLVVVVAVVIVIIDCCCCCCLALFVVAPTSFSTSRCCCCCCWFGNGFCVWNVHFRLLLPSASSAAAAAEQASPGLSGQMGTAFKFRKAAATLSLPQTHMYTHTHAPISTCQAASIHSFMLKSYSKDMYICMCACVCLLHVLSICIYAYSMYLFAVGVCFAYIRNSSVSRRRHRRTHLWQLPY